MSAPRILVVEDDPRTVQLVVSLLRDEPYRLLCANTPEAALRLARTYTPDVVLLSWTLPGMTGDQFADLLALDPSTAGIPLIPFSLEPWLFADRNRRRAVQVVNKVNIADELVPRVRDGLGLMPSPYTSMPDLARMRNRSLWWEGEHENDWRAELRRQLSQFPSPRGRAVTTAPVQ